MKRLCVLLALVLVVAGVCGAGAAEKLLTPEEVNAIYEKEKTDYAELFQKISIQQQKLIAAKCDAATKRNMEAADSAANELFVYVKDPAAWSDYQYTVYSNLNLKSRRKIAKEHGIKAADTFTLESAELFPGIREDALKKK